MLDEQFSGEFVFFLNQYNVFYQEFAEFENSKFEAMSEDNIKLIDDFVKREQALLLKSRGLEKERDSHMIKAGYPQMILREFIPLLDTKYQKNAQELFESLSDSLLSLKDINNRCNNLAQIRLHKIQKELNRQPGYTSSQGTKINSFGSISKTI